ncbi:UNVERIFIED_ORG: hypothetical protein B2H98_05350 [Clostridium botulinum]
MKYRGRPAKYEKPEDMQRIIEAYFKECSKTKEVPTVTGLAFALGTNRQMLLRYENADECEWLKQYDDSVRVGFRDTIKRAKAFIESSYEQALFQQGKTIGAIFTLKNNYGYVDKTEQVVENKTITVDIEE